MVTSAGTCTENGTEERICICCGQREIREIPCAGEHSWGEWQSVEDENGMLTGAKLRMCYVCGEYEREGGVIYGDVNSDGMVTVADAVILARYLANWEVTLDLKAADVNLDDQVSVKDIALLRRYLAEWDVVLGVQQ